MTQLAERPVRRQSEEKKEKMQLPKTGVIFDFFATLPLRVTEQKLKLKKDRWKLNQALEELADNLSKRTSQPTKL